MRNSLRLKRRRLPLVLRKADGATVVGQDVLAPFFERVLVHAAPPAAATAATRLRAIPDAVLTNQPDLDAGVTIVLMTIGSVEHGAVDVWRCDALEAAFWEALSELPMHEFLHDVDENEVCAQYSLVA